VFDISRVWSAKEELLKNGNQWLRFIQEFAGDMIVIRSRGVAQGLIREVLRTLRIQ
jgi:hypothetical protein